MLVWSCRDSRLAGVAQRCHDGGAFPVRTSDLSSWSVTSWTQRSLFSISRGSGPRQPGDRSLQRPGRLAPVSVRMFQYFDGRATTGLVDLPKYCGHGHPWGPGQPARSKRARLARVWLAVQDGQRACGLLYLTAVLARLARSQAVVACLGALMAVRDVNRSSVFQVASHDHGGTRA
jgi:hypothetical protein